MEIDRFDEEAARIAPPDVRERMARIIDPEAPWGFKWPAHDIGMIRCEAACKKADAILAMQRPLLEALKRDDSALHSTMTVRNAAISDAMRALGMEKGNG